MGTVTMALTMCLATSGLPPDTNLLVNQVDLIEINHCYDENGQLVFDQLLFYDWSPEKGHYDVRDWRLLKSSVQVPRRNQETGGYVTVWRDGNAMRKVHSKTIRETWTQYDPEIVEQEFLPKDQRRSLLKISMRRVNSAPPAREAVHRHRAGRPADSGQSDTVRR